MKSFLELMNELKYAFLTITTAVIAHIPAWVHDLSEWAQVIAKIGGAVGVLFGVAKMVDQFLLRRKGIDLFNRK